MNDPQKYLDKAAEDGKYTVVARRYRPKNFNELVGQENVAQALSTAIRTGRVGHAYLFTGARGVGKTSTARIFAKALNAEGGPNPEPDLDSDIALAIDSGEDMDVIEIDGASNRGIEEIRQLRANVNVRPSRSRFKIYIIDEVHMLTIQAFNALLKTLEEPPAHVKFIFCTTDPEKIPITVLSRCQRFDFSPVQSDKILARLQFICEQEGAKADAEALQVIARRANGSMRDSQSLLEQILSFSSGEIRVEDVFQILGAADESLLGSTVERLMERDGGGAIAHLDQAVQSGVDPGQFGEQLLGYLRDILVLSVGAPAELVRTASPQGHGRLMDLGKRWGSTTLVSAIQLLDEALVKMRHSVQGRILLEVALIQIGQLQDLQKISDLIEFLRSGKEPDGPVIEKKKSEIASSIDGASDGSLAVRNANDERVLKSDSASIASPNRSMAPEPAPSSAVEMKEHRSPPSIDRINLALSEVATAGDGVRADEPLRSTEVAPIEIAAEQAQTETFPSARSPQDIWNKTLLAMEGFVADYVQNALRAEQMAEGKWRIVFPKGSDLAIEYCELPENWAQIQKAFLSVLGRPVQVSLFHSEEPPPVSTNTAPRPSVASQGQLIRALSEHPFIQAIRKELGGEIERVDAAQTLKGPVQGTHQSVASA